MTNKWRTKKDSKTGKNSRFQLTYIKYSVSPTKKDFIGKKSWLHFDSELSAKNSSERIYKYFINSDNKERIRLKKAVVSVMNRAKAQGYPEAAKVYRELEQKMANDIKNTKEGKVISYKSPQKYVAICSIQNRKNKVELNRTLRQVGLRPSALFANGTKLYSMNEYEDVLFVLYYNKYASNSNLIAYTNTNPKRMKEATQELSRRINAINIKSEFQYTDEGTKYGAFPTTYTLDGVVKKVDNLSFPYI